MSRDRSAFQVLGLPLIGVGGETTNYVKQYLDFSNSYAKVHLSDGVEGVSCWAPSYVKYAMR